MTILRRCIGVLLQAALLVLPLNSARAMCADDHAAMAGMPDMPGMTMPNDAGSGHHECPADASQSCDSMLACAAVVMDVAPTHAVPLPPVGAHVELRSPRDPLSVTRAPEPPPPRA